MEPFSNREIQEMISAIKSDVSEIKSQTTKTNGRVGKLERWQSFVLGFCACITVILLPTLFLAGRIIFKA